MNTETWSRRDFVRTTATVAALAATLPAVAVPAKKRNHKLGFDNFAVRAMKWNARQDRKSTRLNSSHT